MATRGGQTESLWSRWGEMVYRGARRGDIATQGQTAAEDLHMDMDDRWQRTVWDGSSGTMTLQESEEWSSHYIKRSFGRTTRQTTPTWATRFVYLQAASSGPGLVQTLVNLKESYTSVTFFYSYCMIPGWKSGKACSPADNVMKWQSLQLWKAPWLRKRWEPAVGSWAGSSLQKHDSYYRNPACNWVDSLLPLVMPASACIHDDSCPTWCVIG